MRVVLFLTERCPEQRPRAALKPQEPHSALERALDPGRPRRGPRESRSRGRRAAASRRSYQLSANSYSFAVAAGKAALTLRTAPTPEATAGPLHATAGSQ